ncbi:MAG: hypothetical protein ABR867_00005, partial [Nitrososphaerales archaeon]
MICFLSLVVLAVRTNVRFRGGMRRFDVSYVDNREDGGFLTMSYVAKRRKRDSLVPKSVERYPDGFREFGAKMSIPTIKVAFDNPRIIVALGFLTTED